MTNIMKILLSQINQKIHPNIISKKLLSNIVAELFSKLNACYNHELSHIIHKDKKEQRLCEIVHTHCYNGTATTKKAIKNTLKKYLSSNQYNKFGLKLLYAILETGVEITSDKSILLIEESQFMNVDQKLKAIAMKVMDKMDVSKSDKDGSVIMVIMIIGVILSLIRVIQECNKQKLAVFDRNQKSKYIKEQVNSICINKSFINKWRLRKILKEKLNPEDYKLYANKLRDAILDTGKELTEDESCTLVEAANV